jgi:NADH-quinone oxidoreductase subunit A
MDSNYFARYVPFLLHALIAVGVGAGMLLLTTLLGKRRYSRAKFQPYECGITPTGDARDRFSVKFFMVGILFILFDVEAIFMYPWAVILRELKMFGFFEMLTYVVVILVGFLYIWKKGVLDWALAKQQRAAR